MMKRCPLYPVLLLITAVSILIYIPPPALERLVMFLVTARKLRSSGKFVETGTAPKFNNDDGLFIWKVGKPVVSTITSHKSLMRQFLFLTRLKQFNEALSKVRRLMMSSKMMSNNTWPTADSEAARNRILIRGDKNNFMQQLDLYQEVVTVLLPWIIVQDQSYSRKQDGEKSSKAATVWNGMDDSWNLLINQYYTWTGDDQLCEYVDSPGAAINVPKDRNCSTDIFQALQPTVLDPIYLNWAPIHSKPGTRPTSRQMSDMDEIVQASSSGRRYHVTPMSQLYVHVFDHAVVTSVGDVITRRFKFVPNGCQPFFSSATPREAYNSSTPTYTEMFVSSQVWGWTVFHRAVEVLPRLAAFIEFLHSHPDVVIHVPSVDLRVIELTRMLGIENSRLVFGIVRARKVYVPPVTLCGQPGVRQVQLMSATYRKFIADTWGRRGSWPRRIVLIERTGLRRFTRPQAIVRGVRSAAMDFGLEFSLYGDNPGPTINDTMRMFNSAVMVVGPHGAGETNVIFSNPGVFVIEVVCRNMCLKHTVVVMGHRWHGIRARNACRDGVVDVLPSSVELAVRRHLAMWKQLKMTTAATTL